MKSIKYIKGFLGIFFGLLIIGIAGIFMLRVSWFLYQMAEKLENTIAGYIIVGFLIFCLLAYLSTAFFCNKEYQNKK